MNGMNGFTGPTIGGIQCYPIGCTGIYYNRYSDISGYNNKLYQNSQTKDLLNQKIQGRWVQDIQGSK
eukprot:10892126-Ditylum_brightwellii.AAC.1